MTFAEKMRALALSNKEVKKLYQEALLQIEESAKEGDLSCIIDNDETVNALLIKDGFTLNLVCANTEYAYTKIKVNW